MSVLDDCDAVSDVLATVSICVVCDASVVGSGCAVEAGAPVAS
jgi:hypothetical protein